MEEILDVYIRPYDARFPQIGFDEGSVQFQQSRRAALPMEPGKPKREDYEYERGGFCSLFLACEPLTGKRFVDVRERRTKRDFAFFLRDLIDLHYPDAEKLVVVWDNLHTHPPGALYEVFPPAEAMRLWKKLEIHYTPRHGSWLNMAEIELSVLGRQALSGRLKDIIDVRDRVRAWQEKRTRQQATITWRFTSHDARIRLARLYPSIEA